MPRKKIYEDDVQRAAAFRHGRTRLNLVLETDVAQKLDELVTGAAAKGVRNRTEWIRRVVNHFHAERSRESGS
ncbi:MAG: hypothetical protein Q7J32_00600 [Sphingomonadaceae bacterium]|nr:hypothetical protein [Sphingomonadaceae bacterium]